jgi:anti-anti-sigma factor
MNGYSKADIHIHTDFSDGLHEPEAIVNYVVTHTDLRLIAITDHNTIDGARVAYEYWQRHRDTFTNLEVIKGVEVSSADGHILALFVEEDIPEGLSAADTVRAIHEQGGLAIAAHPFTHLLPFTDFHGIGRQIGSLPLDGVEARSSVPTELYANWLTAAYNRRHANHSALGSSDAHYLTMVGKTYTWFPGQTAVDFRQAVEKGTVRAGGRVNGPVMVLQVINHLLRRRQLPLFLPHDDFHRRAGPGIDIQVKRLRPGNTAVLYCRGRLVRANAELLRKETDRLLASHISHLVVTLADVEFIDSAGIGALLVAFKRAQAANGQLLFCTPSQTVLRTLKLARLDKVFPIFENAEMALQELAGKKLTLQPAVSSGSI